MIINLQHNIILRIIQSYSIKNRIFTIFKAISIVSILSSTPFIEISAQQIVNTIGGNDAGINGFVSFSVGQITYSSNISSDGNETQGVQQPSEIWSTFGIDMNTLVDFECQVFPIPSTDLVNIMFSASIDPNVYSYECFDITGKLLTRGLIGSNLTMIHLGKFSSQILFLKVSDCSNQTKTFVIIMK